MKTQNAGRYAEEERERKAMPNTGRYAENEEQKKKGEVPIE